MIQDILPDILRNEYEPKDITEDSVVFCFNEGNVLCNTNSDEVFPRRKHFESGEYTYLFSIGGTDCFLVRDETIKPPDGFTFENTSIFRSVLPHHFAFAGVTAQHLNNWYAANRFCGHCGNIMEHDCKERMVKCTSCDNKVYPRISPAVIVGVTDGNRLLLTCYAGRAYRRYSLVAGFVEIGERAEDTVRREVLEETGINVKNIRYYKSQPWGFSESLLLGYYAELDGSPELTVDGVELSEAVWIEKEDIDVTFDNISLTNEMICHFKGLL